MKLLLLLTVITFGAGLHANAAEQPQCQPIMAADGATGLTCNNLSNEQSLSVMSQDPTAARRCFRVCEFRAGPVCLRYRVECQRWGGGGDGDHGGGWGHGGHDNGGRGGHH
ncbi:MAG: hypothetical protein ACXWQO_18685 [Bdellovibrionota bacterium]